MIALGGVEVVVEDLWVSYRRSFGRTRVLKGLNMKAGIGSITAIIGRNGVGKTTLFRTLLGFQTPDQGRCTIRGLESRRYREEFGIGYVPEFVTFPPHWTVADLLSRAVDLCVAPPERKLAMATAVARVGLDDPTTLSQPAGRCSKGLQQRIKLAFALIGDPGILLFDEPFSGLDAPSRVALRMELDRTRADGATLIFASHDLNEVAKLADSVYLMSGGTLRGLEPSQYDAALFEAELVERDE